MTLNKKLTLRDSWVPSIQTVFSNALTSHDNTTPGNDSFRINIAVGFASLGKVRVTLKAGPGAIAGVAGIKTNHVAIGVLSSGTATVTTPVELLFGGVSGCTADTASATVTSDFATLSFLSTDTLVVILDNSASEGFDACDGGTPSIGAAGNVFYFTGPAATYNTTAPAGGSNFGAFGLAVTLVETSS